MKKIFLISLLCIGLHSLAQPVLSTTSNIGYVAPYAVASAATAPLTPIGTMGANVTWDASGLIKDAGIPLVSYSVLTPVGTMYAADYPAANWYFTDPALVALVGHTYYNLSSDSFVLWGAHVTGSPYEIYDNPEMELTFPFSYNQTINNSYSKTNYNAGGGISSIQNGDVTLTYDGYGTLILPNGTYNNVVRIKKVRTNNLGPTLTSYRWYKASDGEQLLMYEEKAGGTLNVVYNANVVNSISDIQNNKLIHISNNVDINYITIKADNNISSVSLYTITGQRLKQYNQINANYFHLSKESSKGLYLVAVEIDGHTTMQKVIF